MIYTGSVVYTKKEDVDKAVQLIEGFEGFEVHAISDDKEQIVISIETESEKKLEEDCARLKSFVEIMDVGHHIFHFEEEVDRIMKTGEKPDLKGFFKSKKKEDRKGE